MGSITRKFVGRLTNIQAERAMCDTWGTQNDPNYKIRHSLFGADHGDVQYTQWRGNTTTFRL